MQVEKLAYSIEEVGRRKIIAVDDLRAWLAAMSAAQAQQAAP